MSWLNNNIANSILTHRRPIYRPSLTIAQRVIDAIVANASRYETETGEALIGMALPRKGDNAAIDPDLVVLDTIAPDASVIQTSVYFEQGDYLQDDTFAWLSANWNDMRKRPESKPEERWNTPLIHLGDWHKHPGMLVEPSIGDSHTAVDLIFDRDIQRPYVLAILATIWERESAYKSVQDLINVPIKNGTPLVVDLPADPTLAVRIDCWYLSRQTRIFVRIDPTVVPNNALPTLPIVGWHLRDTKRVWREYDAFRSAGYSIQFDEHDTDGIPPRELCFTLISTDERSGWIIVTSADYPAQPPILRRISTEALGTLSTDRPAFDQLWPHSVPVPPAELPPWQPDRLLVTLLNLHTP